MAVKITGSSALPAIESGHGASRLDDLASSEAKLIFLFMACEFGVTLFANRNVQLTNMDGLNLKNRATHSATQTGDMKKI